jgi:plasmid stabilization system protein ParE
MGWRIIFAPGARDRLVAIVRFISRDDPQAAIRFGDYLIERAEALANFPELGMPCRKRPNVRRLLCKSYYIYYRVRRNEEVIEIMDFWHAARREPPF